MCSMISDPIEFELFKNSIFSIADEMALTIFRTTYSGVLKDNMDYSTAMFDGSGNLAAQGLTLPGHLGSMPTAMAAIKEAFAGQIGPGDVFILNDPFQGGMHLPDVFIFKPIFAPSHSLPRSRGREWEGARRASRLRRDGVPSHRCRWSRAWLECIGLDRDLSGRAAYPTAQTVRSRHPQRHALRVDRAQRPGAGQSVW
jgi:hypothetical protein